MKYFKNEIFAKCPACESSNSTLLWSTSAKAAASHFLSSKKDPSRHESLTLHIASLWGGNDCDVIKCSSCGFVYSYPYIAGDKKFYDLAYSRSGYPSWKWEFEFAFNVITNGSINEPRILEIGAGDGGFLGRLTGHITCANNVVAIEYSDFGRSKIENLGVRCFSKDVRDLSPLELGGEFDYICLFQVLEHLDKIDDLLKSLDSLLKNTGEIIIAVPNEKRIEFNELNDALLDMPPNHIGRWNIMAFQRYAKRNNFVVLQHQCEPANIISEMAQFMKYRLLKKSQNVNTLSHFFLYGNKGVVRLMGLALLILIDAIGNFGILFRMANNIKNRGGMSQIVRLNRIE